jgi:hypothetical protein
MTPSPARQIAERVSEQQALILAVTRDLTATQLTSTASLHAPAIGFHLWHIARWADIVQAHLPTMGAEPLAAPIQEIWQREGLAASWGLSDVELGYRETGMGLADADAQALTLPSRATLVTYATRTFDAAAQATLAVDDERFVRPGRDPLGRESTIGGAVLNHLLHLGRHLGMIVALRGVMGLHGTATR